MASENEQDNHSRRRRDQDDNTGRPRHREDRRDHRSRHSHKDRERRGSRDRRRSRTPEDPTRQRRNQDGDRDRDRDRSGDRDRRRRRSRDDRDSKRRRYDEDKPEDSSRAVAKRRQSPIRRKGPLPSQQDSFAVTQDGGEPEKPKEKPNLGNTGMLAAISNSVAQADGSSITLKYHEPSEARKPSPRDQWKLFVFKGSDVVDTIDLSARSCWLVGREMTVVDLPAEHPSISKQHAVIQFRYTEKRNEFGDKIGKVKPYLIDLESANGTMLNDGKIPDSRYLELRDKDVVQFGHSTREYVVMLAPRD
ncbi:FHA domain-containing protein DDL [Cladobotryum mycophilum]|uniref:FHA domain-containing protein DDL n=1 Tax=Cladobotryum mycophilum TaxID=491253 RepID=A0ABR0STW9_9HYPO